MRVPESPESAVLVSLTLPAPVRIWQRTSRLGTPTAGERDTERIGLQLDLRGEDPRGHCGYNVLLFNFQDSSMHSLGQQNMYCNA